MTDLIPRLINKHSNWKSILVVFVLFLGLKLLFDFHVVPTLEEKTGGYPAPDINFSTSPETVKAFVLESNEGGLDYYRNVFFVVDIFFPFFLCAFLVLSLNNLTDRLFPQWSMRKIVLVLPVVGMVFDYIESVGIVVLISSSDCSPALAQLVAISFWIKMFFGLSSLLLVTLGAVIFGVKSVRGNEGK